MRTRVLLNLEGKHRFVGLLSADRMGALFQYAPEFVAEGLEVSPLSCPLRAPVFRGIPGFVSDSLPDGCGNLLLSRRHACEDRRLAETAISARLAGIGNQGMRPWNSSRKRRARKNLVVTTAATALISMPLPTVSGLSKQMKLLIRNLMN